MSKKYLSVYNFFFNYFTSSNLTYLWNFCIISFLFFLIQFLAVIVLFMYYFLYDITAFLSVENIMKELEYWWLIMFADFENAFFFFFFVFMHIFSNFYFFPFLTPKYQIWNIEAVMFVLMMVVITAFIGYVLPWGYMSFLFDMVIADLFSSILIFFFFCRMSNCFLELMYEKNEDLGIYYDFMTSVNDFFVGFSAWIFKKDDNV